MSQISTSPMRSLVGIAARRSARAVASPMLAEIPPAVQNPAPSLSKQPIEIPVLKVSASSAPKLADDRSLPDTHLTTPYVPAIEPARVGQPVRLPPVEKVTTLAPLSANPGNSAKKPVEEVVQTKSVPANRQAQIARPKNVEVASRVEVDNGQAAPAKQASVAKSEPGQHGQNLQTASRMSPSRRTGLVGTQSSVRTNGAEKASASTHAAQKYVEQTPRPRAEGHVPQSIQSRLEPLLGECETGIWARDAERLLAKLDLAIEEDSDEMPSIFENLEALIAKTEPLASHIDNQELAAQLRRTCYALSRRVVLWKQAILLAEPAIDDQPHPAFDRQRLGACLDRVDAMAKKAPAVGAWETYLLFDSLRELVAGKKAHSVRETVRVVQSVLDRLIAVPMDEQQQAFVNSEAIAALRTELQHVASNTVDIRELLERLEQFEQHGSPADAQLLAEDSRRLSVSPCGDIRQLGEQLDGFYRNANIRAVVTQTLLNRLIPSQGPEYTAVNDTILGVPVAGQAVNTSSLGVRFLPNPDHLRVALQVTGRIQSETAANAGPATFYNNGEAEYSASKAMEIDASGIKMAPAEVTAYSRTTLRGVHTQFDGIPLIGSLAQNVARSQQEQSQDQANQETEGKISARAKQRIDTEAYAKVYDFTQKVRRRIYQPLSDLSLQPTMIGAQTSDERLAMRLRLAAEDQLGAFTPRPRAPADSVASLQLHESAVNNLLEKLDLDGRTATLPELSRYVASRLNRPEPWVIDPAHEDVTVTFAPKNALAVRFQDGQAVLTLSIARFSKGTRAWHDFQVRVCYRPRVEGRSAELVRDGTIQLAGMRLNIGAQIALRGVFSKAFPKDSTFKLTPQRFLSDPTLANLAVSQFVIEDGWIGAALAHTNVSQASTVSEKQLPTRE